MSERLPEAAAASSSFYNIGLPRSAALKLPKPLTHRPWSHPHDSRGAAAYSARRARTAAARARWAARHGVFVFHRAGRPIRDFYAAWESACQRAAVQSVDGREVVVRPQLLARILHDF